MRFGYTILYVADVTRSLDFYGRAFGLPTKFADETGSFGELDTGTTSLAASSCCARSARPRPPPIPIARPPRSPSSPTTFPPPSNAPSPPEPACSRHPSA